MSKAPPSPVKPYSSLTLDTRTSTITPFSLALEDTQHSTDDEASLSSNEGIEVLGADASPTNLVSWAHLWSGKIVRNRLFKRGVLFNILLVSIIMGIATVDHVRERPGLARTLEGIVQFFRFVFTVEILLDVLHYQRQSFQMGWV